MWGAQARGRAISSSVGVYGLFPIVFRYSRTEKGANFTRPPQARLAGHGLICEKTVPFFIAPGYKNLPHACMGLEGRFGRGFFEGIMNGGSVLVDVPPVPHPI